MNIHNPITNAVIILIVVVVAFGVILGMSLSQNDLLNPRTSEAMARRIDVETDHMDSDAWLAEQQRIKLQELELEYAREKAALELKLAPIREYVLLAAAVVALVIVAVGIAFLLVGIGNRWAEASRRDERWKSRAYREAAIQMARANEMAFRQAFSPAASRSASDNGSRASDQQPQSYGGEFQNPFFPLPVG